MAQDTVNCDVLVVGAGPAGLTAACYLARYRRRVIVVHDGQSRALHIPLTHNAPGFPGGIAGPELIARLEEQAVLYGAEIRRDRIEALKQGPTGFEAQGASAYRARAVIIATGIQLNEVELPREEHEDALKKGCLRYCPVCDGYEATGKSVGVLGSSAHGGREALFLREFTDDVTLLPKIATDLSAEQREALQAAGVKVRDSAVEHLCATDSGMEVRLADGERLCFDVLYPAFGSVPQSHLAQQLELELAEDGCIPDDPNLALAIPGLYAAGDVVEGLDQISVAFGHGAMAATRAHNHLRDADGRVLEVLEEHESASG